MKRIEFQDALADHQAAVDFYDRETPGRGERSFQVVEAVAHTGREPGFWRARVAE